MLVTTLVNEYVNTLVLEVKKELGYLDKYVGGCNDSNLEGLFLGYSLGSTDGKVLGSYEGIKLGYTDGKLPW